MQTPGCSAAFASSIHLVPAPLPRSLPEAAALAVSPGSFHPQGYTTFTIIHCHGRQVRTTAEGKISEEVEGHKGQLPVCPHQRGQVSPTCGYRFTATSASAHCELGLAWQRLQGTMHRALPHGNLIPGGGTDQEKERRGRRRKKNCKCQEENKRDAKSDGASCSGGLVRQCCLDEVTVTTGLGQRGKASLLWAEWFQGTVSPGPQADLGRFHPNAEMRKQVQGGEGTRSHSELVVEQESQTFRLHRLCAWQPHSGWDGGGSWPGDEARLEMQGCSHVSLEATLWFSIQGWSFGKILSDDSDF